MSGEKACDLISELYWLMRKKFESELEALGVTFMEFKALIHLKEIDLQSEIIRKMGVSKGTASKVLKSLEDKGIIIRETLGRKYAVKLTKKGLKVIEEIQNKSGVLEKSMFSEMSNKERACFLHLLEKAIKGLEGGK